MTDNGKPERSRLSLSLSISHFRSFPQAVELAPTVIGRGGHLSPFCHPAVCGGYPSEKFGQHRFPITHVGIDKDDVFPMKDVGNDEED